jgi:magnesium transporter
MDREDAAEARMMLEYPPDCAGGLMISEFLAFRGDQTVQDVLDDLQHNRDEYADYHVQYFYVVDDGGALVGVLRIHDLLFPKRNTKLTDIMIPSPLAVNDRATVRELDARRRRSQAYRRRGAAGGRRGSPEQPEDPHLPAPLRYHRR